MTPMPIATSYYRFVRCQVHPDFDDVQGWFLEVQADDTELLESLHTSMAAKYRSMFGEDSHGTNSQSHAALLAAHWLRFLQDALREGEVLVNAAGGFVAKRDLIVVAEVESDDLTWPEHFDDEIITISKWPRGRHYYLCSNRERVFVPGKFNSYQAAEIAALRYVSAGRIRSRP